MDIILPELAQNLKYLRKKAKRTQREIGELLECTTRHYQKIEAGEVNIPVTTLCILADYFGVTTDYLLGREEKHCEGD